MMYKITQKQNDGFALLYIMLMLAALLTTLALTSARAGIFSGNRMTLYQNAATTRMIAMQCAETLLMQVRNDTALNTAGTLSIQSGSCSYTVGGTSPAKTITLTATYNNIYKRITINTSQVTPMILSTWLETAN